MPYKMTKQTFLIISLLCLLTLQLYLSYVKASTTEVTTIDKFNLYFSTNSKLAFQHSQSLYTINPFIVTLTVNSGTLNGTDTSLTMSEASGTLKFRNRETTTITLTSVEEVSITVNGQPYSTSVSFTPNQDVTISWNYFKAQFLLPLMFILGMIGLAGMFVGPMYAIHLVKKGEYYEGFRTGLIITALCFALVIAWLWSGA